MWCWGRCLRVPGTGRSNQSILREINSKYSLEGLMLKRQYFGHLMQRSQLIRKDADTGKDWWQEKEAREDEIARWQHQPNRHEFEQTLRDSEGQGSLVCCSPRGRREFDMIEWLNINMQQQSQYHLGANRFPTRNRNPRLHLGSTKLEYIYYDSWMICIYIKFWEVWL